MNVRCFDSPEQATAALAGRIADAIRHTPALVLGLPTGRTSISLYAELRRLHAAGALDFSRVSTFNLDEFVGLEASDAGSFRQFMERHLFRSVTLTRARIHFLDGAATDPDTECARYEDALDAAGGIDLHTHVGGGKVIYRRKAFQEAFPVGNDGGDLRLLEHDLGDEDVVRVGRAPPRQVAAVRVVPPQQLAPERAALGGRGQRGLLHAAV